MTDLPYIYILLDTGCDQNWVRDLFVRFCLIEGGQCEEYGHRSGFWVERSAWDMFGTADELLAFALALAEVVPGDVLNHHDRLAFELGNREMAGGCQPGSSDFVVAINRYSEETRADKGKPKAKLAMMRAARNLGMVENNHQLELLQSLPIADVSHAAARVSSCWIRNLLLQGYVLADNLADQRCVDVIISQLYDEAKRRPEQVPEMYRWVLEGIKRAGGEQYWQFSRHYNSLRYFVTNAGWEFQRVTARDNPRRPGQPDLQVELKDRGTRVVLKYRKGDLGDHLKEGDEVIVGKWLYEGLTPVFAKPGFAIYVVELPAAAPPNWGQEREFTSNNRFSPDRVKR